MTQLTPELHDKIIETHSLLVELKTQLMGDGTTGELPRLKTRVGLLEKISYTGIGAVTVILWFIQQKLTSGIIVVPPH